MKKLIPALALLVVSAVLMGTSTFAWFSLNNKVSVTGMQISTKVGDSLLIAPSTTEATTVAAENTFKRTYVASSNTLLEPVSTADGEHFFYNKTTNVVANGDAATDSYVAYDHANTTDFDTNYGTSGAKGYVDYAFQIKAFNANSSASAYVNLSTLKLTYGGSAQTQKAFRVAMYVNDMGADGSTDATAPTNTSLKTILRPSGATYFTTNSAVSAVDAAPTAVDGKIDDAALIGTLAPSATRYFKVVIRLWLEGEDSTCNNTTFAQLSNEWGLDLYITVDSATGGVTELEQAVTASLEDVAFVQAGTEATVVDGTNYYQLAGHTDFYITTSAGYVEEATRIYKLVTQDGKQYPMDVTNQCKKYYLITITNNDTATITVPATFKVYHGGSMVITATGMTTDYAGTVTLSAGDVAKGADTLTLSNIAADATLTITAA